MRLHAFKLLALALVFAGLTGCGQSSQATAISQGTATVPTQSAPTRTDYTAFGDSITCGFVAAGATTSPPYSIGDASCHTANAYPSYIATSTSLPLHNDGIPADQACDVWPRQLAPQSVSPTLASAPLYSVMIGTNDAVVKGAGAYESTYSACNLATFTWLALPLGNKVLPAAAAASGWSLGSLPTLGGYAMATTPGATLSFSITTYGGPIYLWRVISDTVPGLVTYTVEGVSKSSFATQLTTPMATQNGDTSSVAAERITGISAGTHTVVLTLVSGVAVVLGVGTPPASKAANSPIVLVGSIPLPLLSIGAYLIPADNAYNNDLTALVNTLQSDGLDVRYAPNQSYMTGSAAEMTDLLHVSPLGAAHLAEAFLAVAP